MIDLIDEFKTSLTIDDVFNFVAEMGGEPRMDRGGVFFTATTICHGGDSHKLYYYDNTHLFKCFTNCGNFDIFELVIKIKKNEGEDWPLPKAVQYVAQFFGINLQSQEKLEEQDKLQDWKKLNRYAEINSIENNKRAVELTILDKNILQYFPQPHILPWEREGISTEVMESRGIKYDPISQAIIIPHYNCAGNLIGIRDRTLIKEDEIYGKYRPWRLGHKMFNHPLGFNLYNLNFSKDNIAIMQRAIVFEGEKSCLKYASMFGIENDISVAVCGSSLISYQVELLLSLGVKEIIIAFDKQFKEKNDEDFKLWTKKLIEINSKYSQLCQISFMFDKWNLLGYKDSPIDCGKDAFLELYKKRIIL